eukprot:2894603-Amphidinium_carterae.1
MGSWGVVGVLEFHKYGCKFWYLPKDASAAQQTLEEVSREKANDHPWRRTADITVAKVTITPQ